MRNAYGQTTQAGRATIQVNAIAGLPCPDFGADAAAGAHARCVAGLNFAELSELEPFAYCFRDENRWRIDDVVAEMIGLDTKDRDVREMLAHYRLMFASEPNVNGRNRGVLGALGGSVGGDCEQGDVVVMCDVRLVDFGVHTDYVMHVCRDVLEEVDSPMLRHGLEWLEWQRILVVSRVVGTRY